MGSRGCQDFVQSPEGRTRVQRAVRLRRLPLQSHPKLRKLRQRGTHRRRNHRRLSQASTQRFGTSNLNRKKNQADVTSQSKQTLAKQKFFQFL